MAFGLVPKLGGVRRAGRNVFSSRRSQSAFDAARRSTFRR